MYTVYSDILLYVSISYCMSGYTTVCLDIILCVKKYYIRKYCIINIENCFRLKKSLDFYRVLSKSLFRERRFIRMRSNDTLSPLAVSNGQSYAVEDLHLLKSLVDKHGRHWKTISKEMNR